MASQQGHGTPKSTPLQKWLRIDPQQRPKAYAHIYALAEMSSFNYWLEIIFSAGIATFGLILNSPAVIIGAMLISPLMSPIMATGLALAAGDLYLTLKAIANLAASISLAIAFSALIVWLLPFHSATPEILARINPTLLDLGVAIFSGLAGSVAVCRFGGSEAVATLPGVAIAVALMPPLCTVGFGLGSGANNRIMGGAGLLFLTNLVAIVASAFAVFLLVGMDSPEVRSATVQARENELFARKLAHSPLSRILASGGQLRWRVLMLVIVLGAIAVPLRTAFLQVAGEAKVRGAIQDVVKQMMPAGSLVSQQVEVGRDSVAIRLTSTRAVAANNIQSAEREIERRSGRQAVITVDSIARQSELAELMRRLTSTAQPTAPPPLKSLREIHDEVVARVTPILSDIWPAAAPLQDFDVAFDSAGIAFNVRYASTQELGRISQDMIVRQLQEKLGTDNITLKATRVHPPRKPSGTSK
jgi:uncharacterized hydrophobic protein (TIGR00271 family)